MRMCSTANQTRLTISVAYPPTASRAPCGTTLRVDSLRSADTSQAWKRRGPPVTHNQRTQKSQMQETKPQKAGSRQALETAGSLIFWGGAYWGCGVPLLAWWGTECGGGEVCLETGGALALHAADFRGYHAQGFVTSACKILLCPHPVIPAPVVLNATNGLDPVCGMVAYHTTQSKVLRVCSAQHVPPSSIAVRLFGSTRTMDALLS